MPVGFIGSQFTRETVVSEGSHITPPSHCYEKRVPLYLIYHSPAIVTFNAPNTWYHSPNVSLFLTLPGGHFLVNLYPSLSAVRSTVTIMSLLQGFVYALFFHLFTPHSSADHFPLSGLFAPTIPYRLSFFSFFFSKNIFLNWVDPNGSQHGFFFFNEHGLWSGVLSLWGSYLCVAIYSSTVTMALTNWRVLVFVSSMSMLMRGDWK